MLHRSGCICATNDIQPFLHIILVLKLCTLARARGLEKGVQVELIKLSGTRNRHKFVGHLVGEQPHLWHCAVRIPRTTFSLCKLLLSTLLIGVGPIKDLLFDEFASG